MDTIIPLAKQIVQSCLLTHHGANEHIMIDFDQKVKQIEISKLNQCNDPLDLYTLGTAFSLIALLFTHDKSKTINRQASEYAYFFLAKSFIIGKNPQPIVPLFNLLIEAPELVHHSFLSFSCQTIQQESDIAVATSLQQKLSRIPAFNKQIYDLIDYTAYYLSSFFFDIEKDSFIIDDSITNVLPHKKIIHKHILPIYDRHNHIWLMNEGAKNFEGVFSECTHSIANYHPKCKE